MEDESWRDRYALFREADGTYTVEPERWDSLEARKHAARLARRMRISGHESKELLEGIKARYESLKS